MTRPADSTCSSYPVRNLELDVEHTFCILAPTVVDRVGGNLATDAVANAAPDGYTLLIGNQGPMVVNPHL